MPRGTDRSPLSLAEAEAIFDIAAKTRDEGAWAQAAGAAASKVGGPPKDSRTIKKPFRLALELLKIMDAAADQTFTPPTDQDLLGGVGYGMTPAALRRYTNWFNAWLNDSVRADQTIRDRLGRFASYIWLPGPHDVPRRMLMRNRGFRRVSINGRWLRWTQQSVMIQAGSREIPKTVVAKCWFRLDEELKFRAAILRLVPRASRDSLLLTYDQLQRDAAAYLTDVAQYQAYTSPGLGNMTFSEVEGYLDRGDLNPKSIDGQEAARILELFPALENRTDEFVADLEMAVGL